MGKLRPVLPPAMADMGFGEPDLESSLLANSATVLLPVLATQRSPDEPMEIPSGAPRLLDEFDVIITLGADVQPVGASASA